MGDFHTTSQTKELSRASPTSIQKPSTLTKTSSAQIPKSVSGGRKPSKGKTGKGAQSSSDAIKLRFIPSRFFVGKSKKLDASKTMPLSSNQPVTSPGPPIQKPSSPTKTASAETPKSVFDDVQSSKGKSGKENQSPSDVTNFGFMPDRKIIANNKSTKVNAPASKEKSQSPIKSYENLGPIVSSESSIADKYGMRPCYVRVKRLTEAKLKELISKSIQEPEKGAVDKKNQ